MGSGAVAEAVNAGERVNIFVARIEALRVTDPIFATDGGKLTGGAGNGVLVLPIDAGSIGDFLREFDARGKIVLLHECAGSHRRQSQGAAERGGEQTAARESKAGVVECSSAGGAGNRADVVLRHRGNRGVVRLIHVRQSGFQLRAIPDVRFDARRGAGAMRVGRFIGRVQRIDNDLRFIRQPVGRMHSRRAAAGRQTSICIFESEVGLVDIHACVQFVIVMHELNTARVAGWVSGEQTRDRAHGRQSAVQRRRVELVAFTVGRVHGQCGLTGDAPHAVRAV